VVANRTHVRQPTFDLAFSMGEISTRPKLGTNVVRVRDNLPGRFIGALGIALLMFFGPAVRAQQMAPGGALSTTVTKRGNMTKLTVADPGSVIPLSSLPVEPSSDERIRPYRVHIPDAALADLRRRIAATRWPSKELVTDRSQGVQLATLKALAHYWTERYDWRKAEARLNALPQFVTTIDGVDIHFIHVKSRHPNAMPLIMTHGWPGSVIELLETIDPLTEPTAHGGAPDDAFDVVFPSLPGYGFSGEPMELGWDSGRIARAWATLMQRLGYTRYVAQGGDVGAAVSDAMARQAPTGLLGIHVNLLAGASGIADRLAANSDQERAAHQALATFRASGFGYFLEQSTRPQTIGYSLLDSPVGLAGWLLDHDTDSYYKISRAFIDEKPAGRLTRESILDNITLYWLTGTGASAARWYWEAGQAAARGAGQARPGPAVPVAFTTFPGEIFAAPRSWVETVYPGLAYFNSVDRGGHFAAWEEPLLFVSELRAAFKPLR
jgi:pimeloyl-ACP methyl ester carboxylesterase